MHHAKRHARRNGRSAWLRSLAAVALLGGTVQAQAFLVDVELGLAGWSSNFDGTVQAGSTRIDVDDDLDYSRDTQTFIYASFKHPIPLIPNVRAQYALIDVSARNQLEREISFRGETFSAGAQVASELELDQLDATLFYNLWDTVLSLDLGLTFRYVDGELTLAGEGEQARASFSGVLPLVHGRARVDLPFTGFWVGAQVDTIAYSGNRIVDSMVSGGWQTRAGFGVEGGWRHYELKLNDMSRLDRSNIDLSGPFLGVNFIF